jgi:predicted GIY-YIG superfamily endonuclease
MLKEKNTKSGVYGIYHNDIVLYVGSTKNIHERFIKHKSSIKTNNHHNIKLQNYCNEVGLDNITFSVIEETINDKTVIRERESFWIIKLIPKCTKTSISGMGVLEDEDILLIADMYNKGKIASEINKELATNFSISTINSLINGVTYKHCSYLFDKNKHIENLKSFISLNNATKEINRKSKRRIFEENEILKMSELYNLGKSCSEVSLIMYGNRNKRASINEIVKGNHYNHSHLFNYRVYTQHGRLISEETRSKIRIKAIGRKNGELRFDIVKYIRENPKRLSRIQLTKELNISSGTIGDIIKGRSYKNVI